MGTGASPVQTERRDTRVGRTLLSDSRAQLGSLPDCKLISELHRSKYARSIGRKLNDRHARIPAIEIFILAEKNIALP